jgi:hypothetical protein
VVGVTRLGVSKLMGCGEEETNAVWTTGLGGEGDEEEEEELSSFAARKGGGKDKGTLVRTMLFLLATLVDGLGLLELPMGLAKPLLLPARPLALGVITAMLLTSSLDEADGEVRIAAALSRTDGTLSSNCSVVLARGIRCGLGG